MLPVGWDNRVDRGRVGSTVDVGSTVVWLGVAPSWHAAWDAVHLCEWGRGWADGGAA